MVLVLTYLMTFKDAEETLLESEVDVDYSNLPRQLTDIEMGSFDEMGRRYIIAKVLREGGRVIKLQRISSKWSEGKKSS
jgi:hypothetical protein